MHEIDFLPLEYRQRHAQRQSRPWQVVAAVAILSLVAAAAVTQNNRRRSVQAELAIITPAFQAALSQQQRLANVQKRLTAANASAALYTYLRHPWPRTQLLTALVARLPKEIALQQVQILREVATSSSPTQVRTPVDKKTEEENLKLLSPADRDLARLRARVDPLQTVVVLAGTSAESAVLHRYIRDLDATDIFDNAELDCFNSIDSSEGDAVLQFRAVLLVQPGYGQPGGPTGPDKNDVVQTNVEKP